MLDQIPSPIMPSDVLRLLKNNSITSAYFDLLKSLTNFTDEVLSGWLNVNIKTFRSYKSAAYKAEVKADLQEHVVMLLALMKHGIEVFGDRERFMTWLETENFQLGKMKPSDYLNTISGIRFIDSRLTGMEYGDNA